MWGMVRQLGTDCKPDVSPRWRQPCGGCLKVRRLVHVDRKLRIVSEHHQLTLACTTACRACLDEGGRGHGNRSNPPPRQLENGHQTESKVQEWYQMAKNMVFCFRQKKGWINQPELHVEQHSRRLHTQKAGTMTCLVHTFNFMLTIQQCGHCLLYTSPSPRDRQKSRMPSSA